MNVGRTLSRRCWRSSSSVGACLIRGRWFVGDSSPGWGWGTGWHEFHTPCLPIDLDQPPG
jgi:hypothetical protein